MSTKSPLRYPGGKSNLYGFLRELINRNMDTNMCSYFELYAGGAGAALNLLLNRDVRQIILNDADIHIFNLWDAILHHTDDFLRLIAETPVTMDEWHRQRGIYESTNGEYSPLQIGFSAFFLNRTNRSGIISKAGPIGGLDQAGNYKIDCRFNKKSLTRRIEHIAERTDDIEIYNEDTLTFIQNNLARLSDTNSFMYLDPPYYKKGSSLYLNAYTHQDHEQLRNVMSNIRDLKWMISYDDVEEIRELYTGFTSHIHELNYSLQIKRKTNEFFIFSDTIE